MSRSKSAEIARDVTAGKFFTDRASAEHEKSRLVDLQSLENDRIQKEWGGEMLALLSDTDSSDQTPPVGGPKLNRDRFVVITAQKFEQVSGLKLEFSPVPA